MQKLSFSGHESFACKQFWLKKGYDYVRSGKKFSDESSVVDLGIGKNMVRSVRYWLVSFGIIEKQSEISELGELLFGDEGKDPYLEDIGSVWLLQYFLIKLEKASIFSLVFNEFQRTRNGFQREQLEDFLIKRSESKFSPATIERDITAFFKSYSRPTRKRTEIEEIYSGLLQELNLLSQTSKDDLSSGKAVNYYSFRTDKRKAIPAEIFLFTILDNPIFTKSISFNDLQVAKNSPGRVFTMNADGIYEKLQEITKKYKGITYSETAGNRVLQINSKINKWDILNDYYN